VTISLAPRRAYAYDRHVRTRIHDDDGDGYITVERYSDGSIYISTEELTHASRVLFLRARSVGALVTALGDDAAREKAIGDYADADASAHAEISRLRAARSRQITAREEACRERDLARARANDACHELDRMRGMSFARELTPETCDALADACRSGVGEASKSRNHAHARAALQQAADWLRRAEQGR
jgi:hypothetical protein